MSLQLRPLAPEDRSAWETLWQGYLTFYEAELSPAVTDATWARLLAPGEPVWGYAAIADGVMAGIVQVVYHKSTWSVADRCYLHDLFTDPAFRGRGIAKALIQHVYAEARQAGAERVHWLTHETNVTAQALYDRVASRTGFIQYKHLLER